MSINHRFMSFD